ncbi:hypothetical protein DRQ18_05505 [bacterium]|nr:MAG: hypothetical protein DRQ18_05505 [bacterium]
MNTPMKSILLFLLAAFMGAFGQYLYKRGATFGFFNWRILLGVLLYIGVMLCFVLAFKLGGELTVLYPVYATTFIWAMLIGYIFLKEPITGWKILGTLFILMGIYFIAR